MVREIVHIQVGQCGNQIGTAFWDSVCREHHLNFDGTFAGSKENKEDEMLLRKSNVYFNEVSDTRYVARSCMVDLEPATMDTIKASQYGNLFSPDNYIFGQSGAGNNWAKGHYTEGAEMLDEIMDCVRKMTESSDCVQGYQLTQSLGGGTGSGLGTLIQYKIRDNYPDRVVCSFSVFPAERVSNVVVEPYNAILAIHQLLEHTDESFVIDNEALFNISQNLLKESNPSFSQLNHVVSLVMSGITSSLRFPGLLNGDLRKLAVNLVPFPRLHFFSVAQAPLYSVASSSHVNLNVREITRQMWSESNCLAKIKVADGKYLCSALTYRGPLHTQEVDEITERVQQEMKDDFVEWIPNNIKTTLIKVSPADVPLSGTFMANTTAIKGIFRRISAQFGKLYRKRGFLHWYTQEGMDVLEFEEADKNVRDLIDEYQDRQDAVVELEEGEEDEDEETDLELESDDEEEDDDL